MPPRRIAEPSDTCELRVDGERVQAAAGEPVAVALAAAGRVVLGRSVKYHRPRGAACYAGRCDGCLMRVDGRSSVMTCTVPARDGMVIETQNVVGSAKHDLLAATDWFFPKGMDHHHMFTWSKAANQMMQKVARRIAGIGRLPSEVVQPVEPEEVSAQVVVVGGGPTGLVAAAECARAGLDVLLVDESPRLGGHLAFLPAEVEDDRHLELDAKHLAQILGKEVVQAGARVRTCCSAVAVYDARNAERGAVPDAPEHTLVLATPERLLLVRPARILVATGAYEGSAHVPGNDLPGVLGVRATARLLSHGVLPGERVALVGAGHWTLAVKRALERAGGQSVGPFPLEALRRIRGRSEVSGIDVLDGGAEQRVACDAVALAGPRSGAYEIAAQAGADVSFDGEGFFIDAEGDGATAGGWVRAVGQCAGVRSLPEGLRQARAAARALTAELAGERHA